jgi:hypothetical protein
MIMIINSAINLAFINNEGAFMLQMFDRPDHGFYSQARHVGDLLPCELHLVAVLADVFV